MNFSKELSFDKSSIDRVKIARDKYCSADIYKKKLTVSSFTKKISKQDIKKHQNQRSDDSSDDILPINKSR